MHSEDRYARTISTLAGGLSQPQGVAVAPDGSVYASDNNRIVRIDTAGMLFVIAGTVQEGFSGDGGPAAQSLLHVPKSLLFDDAGNLNFFDSNNVRFRRITPAGIIFTFAGNGQSGDPVAGQPATAVSVSSR